MSPHSTNTRLQEKGREVDRLLRFGMQLATAADVYISPSKMAKFVKDAVAHFGRDQAEAEVRALVQLQQDKQIASYERAMRTSSVSTIARFKNGASGVGQDHGGETAT